MGQVLRSFSVGMLGIFLVWGLPVSAQKAIIEDWSADIVCDKPTHAVMHFKKTVTILNKSADMFGAFSCSCSPTDNLTAFKGTVTDGTGRILRKIRQRELQRTEYSPYLAMDDYIMYLDYTPSVYPVTVTYEWDMECRDNLIEFPAFSPQTDYDVTVRKASYRLTVPKDYLVRHALRNISSDVVETEGAKGTRVLTLEADDLPALKKEPYARPIQERLPIGYFAPSFFVYYNTQGSLHDWTDYGKWQFGMLKGRDVLPAATCQELHQLTDGLKDDREKVEAVYEYLRKTTRYVAVLLGVGSLRPAAAAEICSNGYGDCKGLANYMRAMLKEVGIAANYTTISTTNRRLLSDFASVGQMDHVILQVPLQGDTLWIECTNPQLPLGYVHSHIAGHDAIEASAVGGRLVRLPAYPDSANLERSVYHLQLDAAGAADMTISQMYANRQYERHIPLLTMDKGDLRKSLLQMINAPQAEVGSISVEEQAGAQLGLKAQVRSQRYATVTGKRLFVPVIPVSFHYQAPAPDDNRSEDIFIEAGFCDEQEVTFTIPDGYETESLPQGVILAEPFGLFVSVLAAEGNQIRVTNRLQINSGVYDKSLYPQLIAFVKRVGNAYGRKMVLRNNQTK